LLPVQESHADIRQLKLIISNSGGSCFTCRAFLFAI